MPNRNRQQKLGQVAYVNARLLDPATGLDAPGGLLTNGEVIEQVGPGLFGPESPPPSTAQIVDCGGLVLAPGLVDIRMELREPGAEHKESMRSACKAGVAGGVTSMVCLPNTDPVIDDEATLEFVARRARLVGLTKLYCYGACTKRLEGKELAEFGVMDESGAMAFTDGYQAIANTQTMRRILSYAATHDLMVMHHPEDPTLATGVMNAGETSTRLGLPGIPREAEIIMLERDMRLVAMTGCRYHAAHISTSESVRIIAAAKAKGLPVSCDTAPPYFALNEMETENYRTFAKLSPPLRSEEDRRAIVQGLIDGVIDCIASDHGPQDQDAKRRPFSDAAFGAVGLETLLSITLSLVQDGSLSLLQALGLLTHRPATLLDLPVGRLEPGLAADLVLFDPDRIWLVQPEKFYSKSDNTPFDGKPTQGKVMRTVIDGRTVFTPEDGPISWIPR